MKKMTAMITPKIRTAVATTVALTIVPVLAWSHPGHGLDGLWVHDMLHGASAVFAIALVTLLIMRFARHRSQKKRS